MDEFEWQEQLDQLRSRERMTINEEIVDLYERGRSFGHPSYTKYAILFFLAAVIDITALADLSVVGWFFSRLITIPCFFLSIFICWATSTKQKEAQSYINTLTDRIHQISSLARFTIKQTARFFVRHPTFLIALGEGMDIFLPPFLSLLNLSTLWVVIAYRSEKRAYRHAREAADSLLEIQT